MAADLHPKTPPSPEFIAILTWLTQNLWAGACTLLVILGRIVFGNIREQIKEIAEKLDQVANTVNQLAREVSEIKGELKAKDKRQ